MFSTFKQKLFLGIYIFILLSIPVGAYLTSEFRTTAKSSASEKKTTKSTPQPPQKISTPSAKGLLSASRSNPDDISDSPSPSSPTIASSFGPTLSLKVTLEGRPAGNQATKLFVGIAEGTLTNNPKFVLNFTVDIPASGEYSGLSLAGLNVGSTYTALLKGSAQIATSSAFTMAPNITNLNGGQSLNMITGDLNDDNVVNSTDYALAQKALGANANSANWNENIDLNKDGIINTIDMGMISRNNGQVGASGAWTSPFPKVASPSASLTSPPVGGPQQSGNGYWIWVPK